MAEPIDMLERDERAAEAKELLTIRSCRRSFGGSRSRRGSRCCSAEPGSPVAVAHHQRIMAIRAIHADLIRLVDDPKMLRAARERRRRFSQ